MESIIRGTLRKIGNDFYVTDYDLIRGEGEGMSGDDETSQVKVEDGDKIRILGHFHPVSSESRPYLDPLIERDVELQRKE